MPAPVEPRPSVSPNMPPPGRPELVATTSAENDKRNEEKEERLRKEREERKEKEEREKREKEEKEKREREEREKKEERERKERREREERERKMKKEKEEREERERLQEEKKTKENIPINLTRPVVSISSVPTTTSATAAVATPKPIFNASSVDKTSATIAAAQATAAAALAVVAATSPVPTPKKPIIDAYNVLTPSYSLDELRRFDMKGVDRSQREAYLTQADFQAAFGMTRDQFYALPKWKRQDSKAKLGIF